MNPIYITRTTAMPPFVALPRFILNSGLSLNAKLLYGLLLSRSMVSRKNGWSDEQGHVYIIYTIRQLAEDLDRSERTVKNALSELEGQDLIRRVRQGWNQPNHIYVLLPDMDLQRAERIRGMGRKLPLPWGRICLLVIKRFKIQEKEYQGEKILRPLAPIRMYFFLLKSWKFYERNFPDG